MKTKKQSERTQIKNLKEALESAKTELEKTSKDLAEKTKTKESYYLKIQKLEKGKEIEETHIVLDLVSPAPRKMKSKERWGADVSVSIAARLVSAFLDRCNVKDANEED